VKRESFLPIIVWGKTILGGSMKYVYVLRSEGDTSKTYVGLTSNLKRRMRDRNSGQSVHTKRYAPWKLESYIAFSNERKAELFEEYLKHGSGWAFAKRHLV
jgi:putative endonuclease